MSVCVACGQEQGYRPNGPWPQGHVPSACGYCRSRVYVPKQGPLAVTPQRAEPVDVYVVQCERCGVEKLVPMPTRGKAYAKLVPQGMRMIDGETVCGRCYGAAD